MCDPEVTYCEKYIALGGVDNDFISVFLISHHRGISIELSIWIDSRIRREPCIKFVRL